MPSTSKKQERFMQAISHGWKPSGMKSPPSRKVAKEYVAADKKKKMQVGGLARAQIPGSKLLRQPSPPSLRRPPSGKILRPRSPGGQRQPRGALQRAIQTPGRYPQPRGRGRGRGRR